MHLQNSMMRARQHFFTPETDVDRLFTNYTMAATAKQLEQPPSPAAVASLSRRGATKRAYWEEWIAEKKGLRAKQEPPKPIAPS